MAEKLYLQHSDFEAPGELAKHRGLRASAFKYDSGVEALTLENERGKIVLLPFQGHQIWSAEFDGESLGMESLVKEPKPITDYLHNYGAFLLHCGPRRMGCPDASAGDDHELHGTLPNSRFGRNIIHYGEDEYGPYMAVVGTMMDSRKKDIGYRYGVSSKVVMHSGSSILDIIMNVTNNYSGPMEIMRLEHVNFLPVAGSELVYSAPCTPQAVRVRTKDPAHAPPPDALIRLREHIIRNPKVHNWITGKQVYDPELVLYLKYVADKSGWAHSMQVLPNGFAHYIGHRPSQFPIGIRWIRMTSHANEDFPVKNALGLCLPSTAEPEGYSAEKKKGNVFTIPRNGSWASHIKVGLIEARHVREQRKMIEELVRG